MIKPFEMIYQKRKMVITNFGFVYINMAIIKEKFKKKEKTLDFCSPMSYLYYQNHKVRSIYIRNERGRLLLPFFMESLHPTSP